MNLQSIRWRLPLSYAAIAFLAALFLGSVMLPVLHGYYVRQEREYLLGNARSLQPLFESILQSNLPEDFLQEQVNGLSFLSQTRIRVLDSGGNMLADSGIPGSNQILALSGGQAGGLMFTVPVDPSAGSPSDLHIIGAPLPPGAETIVSVSASPYGYIFSNTNAVSSEQRSSQVVELSLRDSLGSIELSSGPAYGSDIVRSVSLAWAGAGGIAILLAGLAGWLASRGVTRPVLALTTAARQMEKGELSTRIALPGRNQAREFSELAKAFNAMAQKVEEIVSTLRAFVADAAHELQTPLTALHTNLELAGEESKLGQGALFMERAQAQAARLETLVSGLLDLSRIEAGGTSAGMESLDLNHLVREAGETFASRAEQAEREFRMELPPETIRVRGNSTHLHRILTNLLENSLKFTPAQGTITLRLGLSGEEAILAVMDNGIGIPVEDQPRLFERFHRGRNTSAYPGNGLGLTIVRALVTVHGGSIRAESTLGKGTHMIVTLPMDHSNPDSIGSL